MKIEQLIVQYLYSNKKVTLQDMGTFTISPEINIPLENDKDAALPPGAIQFRFEPKAVQDDGLIAYIMEHTRKIRPLATSDLESFIMLNTQFLNIGKPLILEGVGTLQKTQAGEYAFTQSGISHVVYEETPKLVTEKQKEQVSFATPPREKSSGGGKAAVWLLLLLLLGGAAYTAYYFLYKKDKANENANTAVVTGDTSMPVTPDTVAAKKPGSIAAMPAVKDSNSFYVVIKEYHDRAAAEKSFDRLTAYGNKLLFFAKDSSFKLRMPFIRPLADTMRIRDSLSKFFSAKTYVELP